MFDQGDYSVCTTTSLFLPRNTTNETCSLAVTQPGAAAEEQTRSVVERVIWSFFLILIILASLIGNMLVLVCVRLHHGLREENSSMFIVNLSVVDMVSAAVVMISSLHALASDKWLMGPAWCDIVCGTNYTLIIVSMFTLCFVSLDRYIAVKHALHYHARVTRTKIYLLLGYAWCLGFCFGLVPILYQWIRFDYWEAVCAIVWHADRKRVVLFVTVGFTLCFVLPSVILVIAYSKVMKIALAHNKVHQKNAEIQASAAKRKLVTTKFVSQILTDEHRRNQHSSENSVLHTENIAKLKDVLDNTSFLPPVFSENEDTQRNIANEPTYSYLINESESSKVQFKEDLTKITAHSDGTLLCEIEVDHHLVSSSSRPSITTGMQPIEFGNKYNCNETLNNHKSSTIGVGGKPVIQTIHNKSVLFQLPGDSNENVDISDQNFVVNQTDDCSQKIFIIGSSYMCDTENYGEAEALSNRRDNLPFSCHSQQTRSNEVCNSVIESSSTTAIFRNPTTQQNTQSLDNHRQSNTQQTSQSEERQMQATEDQRTQIVGNQGELTNDRLNAGNASSENMPHGNDSLGLSYAENNDQKVVDTSHLSRSSNNTNNSGANKSKYAASNKAVKSLLLVVIAYFICMTPFCVTKLCKVVFINDVLPGYVNLVSSIFQYISSAINPLIYGIFRKDFQRAFGLLARRFLGKSGTTNANTSDIQSTLY